MSRGNRCELIYSDDSDCELFLETLTEVCERAGWIIHAYVLMDNHFLCEASHNIITFYWKPLNQI